MSERLTSDLLRLLGEDDFVRLVEAFGGTRLYVTAKLSPDHAIVEAIGERAARDLAEEYAPALLRIPLAREIRARHYEAAGLSNARIARQLGMTETGVEKIFDRMRNRPATGPKLPLFDR